MSTPDARIRFTDSARQAATRDLGSRHMLRIAFAGGCGAMGFRLAATRRETEGDRRVELDGITLLLDRKANAELDGAVLDFDEDEGFQLDHPAWGVSC